jgi:hypothetical protein
MSIVARLQKLESRTGALLPCVVVIAPDETPSAAMRRCGYPDQVIRIVTETDQDASRRFVFLHSEFPLTEAA